MSDFSWSLTKKKSPRILIVHTLKRKKNIGYHRRKWVLVPLHEVKNQFLVPYLETRTWAGDTENFKKQHGSPKNMKFKSSLSCHSKKIAVRYRFSRERSKQKGLILLKSLMEEPWPQVFQQLTMYCRNMMFCSPAFLDCLPQWKIRNHIVIVVGFHFSLGCRRWPFRPKVKSDKKHKTIKSTDDKRLILFAGWFPLFTRELTGFLQFFDHLHVKHISDSV